MQSILTQCPRCQTTFKVSDKQLAIAEGLVRCGSCLDVFSATANRITIKQPLSEFPESDADEYLPDDEQDAAELPLDDDTSPHQGNQTAALVANPQKPTATGQKSAASPLNYKVRQLKDGDAVVPVNISNVIRAGAHAGDDRGVVLDNLDDISLGDMVLDEFDDHVHFETDDGEHEPHLLDDADDADFDIFSTQYGEAEAEVAHQIPNDAPPVLVSASQPSAIVITEERDSYESEAGIDLDAIVAQALGEDGDAAFDPALPEVVNTKKTTALSQRIDSETLAGRDFIGSPAAPDDLNHANGDFHDHGDAGAFTETTHDAHAGIFDLSHPYDPGLTESKPASASPFAPGLLPEIHPAVSLDPDNHEDFQAVATDHVPEAFITQNPAARETYIGPASLDRMPAERAVTADNEPDKPFIDIYEPMPHGSAAADQMPAAYPKAESPTLPLSYEDLYEPFSRAVSVRKQDGDTPSIAALLRPAYPDDEKPAPEKPFLTTNGPALQDFAAGEFIALRVDESDIADKLAARPEKSRAAGREEMHNYLADLEDTDALEPLSPATRDAIEAEPLTMESRQNLRRFATTGGWFLLSVLLIGVFVFQVASNNLERMQNAPGYSEFLPFFCSILNCPEPAADAGTGNFSSQDLLVRSHPTIPDALEVSFIFRSDANLPRPFPLIELNFSSPAGRLMANRLFTPAEYLPPELAALETMPAHSSVQVRLELVDPGSDAVNYEVNFREVE